MLYEKRAFFRKSCQQPDETVDEGTFGLVQFSRVMYIFEGMTRSTSDGRPEDPYTDPEERAAATTQGFGECVGYLPDNVEDTVNKARKAYQVLYAANVGALNFINAVPLAYMSAKKLYSRTRISFCPILFTVCFSLRIHPHCPAQADEIAAAMFHVEKHTDARARGSVDPNIAQPTGSRPTRRPRQQ